jgi:hypothetical protein
MSHYWLSWAKTQEVSDVMRIETQGLRKIGKIIDDAYGIFSRRSILIQNVVGIIQFLNRYLFSELLA